MLLKPQTNSPSLAFISATCLSATLATLSVAAPSLAGTLTYTGTTVGGPTWNRPIQGNPPVPPLSGVGTATPYSVQSFSVDASGAYDFLSTATNPSGWDNYTFLYANSFDPTAQFANVIIGNDDFNDDVSNIGQSGFNGVSLTAGVAYFFVTTGFGNGDAGQFSNTISGPGNISLHSPTPVPEPTTTLALLGFGLLGAGSAVKRRQK
jgi:hypothetical protein